MFDIGKWLDRAKAKNDIGSDYKLAQVAGISHASLINYRSGKTMPDERVAMKICELSGDDPEHVVACIQSMRAANDDVAELWRRVAAKLKGNAIVIMAPMAAILLLALAPVSAEATPLPSPLDGASLYIMSNAQNMDEDTAALR